MRLEGVLAQSNADALRLAQVGVQQVRVFGNLDFDIPPPVKLIARGLEWRQAIARPVVLAAGTYEGEEIPLLDAWKAARSPLMSRKAQPMALEAPSVRLRLGR